MLAADYCNGLPFCLDVSLYDVSSLSYDDNGNILTLSRRDSAGVVIDTLNYNYSSSNRLQSLTENTASTAFSWDAEDANYEYDANGNVISQTEDSNYKFRTIHYDNRNLPVFVELDDFTDIIYLYNADGQRVFKKVDSQDAEHYIMDGSLNVGVFDENGLLKHWNIVAGGVAGRVESGGKLYYLKDHLGSTRALVNETGAVVESHDYYPFGLQMPGRSFPAANTATKEKFTGKERDTETGLDYFGARYYDPSIGRWLSVDPAGQHFSPYLYGSNNPINRIDLDGRIDWPVKGSTAVNMNDYANRAWGLKNTVVRTSTYLDTDRPPGASNPHIGIDYRASETTSFYSLGDGKVVGIGKTSKGAEFIKVEYAGGDQVRFLHISEVAEGLSVGSNVLEGQVLGKTGKTGTKTAHLHIDATDKKGKGIDPENRNYGTVSNKFFFEQLGGDHKLLKAYKDTLTPVTATTDKSENRIVEEEEKK